MSGGGERELKEQSQSSYCAVQRAISPGFDNFSPKFEPQFQFPIYFYLQQEVLLLSNKRSIKYRHVRYLRCWRRACMVSSFIALSSLSCFSQSYAKGVSFFPWSTHIFSFLPPLRQTLRIFFFFPGVEKKTVKKVSNY